MKHEQVVIHAEILMQSHGAAIIEAIKQNLESKKLGLSSKEEMIFFPKNFLHSVCFFF